MEIIEKPPHGSKEWLDIRWRDANGKCTFGASEAPVLMNESRYASRADLWQWKNLEPQVSVETAAFRRGNLFEPVLIKEAAHILGVELTTPDFMYRNGRFTMTPDGVDNPTAPSLIVEAKTNSQKRIRDAADLPSEFLWQGWAQQYVTGAEVVFVVLDATQTISLIELPSNPAALEALEYEAAAFGGCVDEGLEPPQDIIGQMSAQQIASLWKATPTQIELSEDIMQWVEMLEEAKADQKIAESVITNAQDAIAQAMLNNEIGLYRGAQVVTWKQQKGRKSFDAKTFSEDNPTLYENYSKEGKPFRVMRVSRKTGK